jgi:type II secretory pathway pseudopilin PulG
VARKNDPPPAETPEPAAPTGPVATGGVSKKSLLWIGGITLAVWAFTLQTGSTVLMIIVGVLTAVLAGVLIWAFRAIKKQRGLVNLLQGATASTEARKDALAKLSDRKDANSPTNTFLRAQLVASDDPKAALALLEPIELKTFPAAMQDDVSLLKTQIYLGMGRTADARKTADVMNLDNPSRKEIRPLAASIVAEAWARTGKAKEALALLDTIELPKKDAEQIMLQARVAKVFAKFAANQRGPARAELTALADDDVNNLGRFLMPQFRVHPELQKLARRVLEQHPGARKLAKAQAAKR